MIKAINMWSLPDGWGTLANLPETFKRVKGLGYEGLELSFDPDGAIGMNTTADELAAVRKAAADASLILTSIATGMFWFNNYGQDDAGSREVAHKQAVKMLETAQALGITKVLFIPASVDIFFRPEEPVVSYEVAMQRMVDALKSLVPHCERTRVRIGVENVWNKILLSPLEMRDMIDSIGSEYIGSYFDVGNVLRTGYPEQWITILGKRIVSVHFKDYRNAVGTAEGFVDLLEGDVNWPAVMDALKRVNYDGAVIAEMIPQYKLYPLARVENTSNAMDWILGRKS